MENAGKLEQNATMLTKQKNISITFDMILRDMKMILEEEHEIESKLDKCKKIVKAVSDDDIDAYINSLKTTESSIDALTRAKMKKRLAEVKNEMVRLEKLCKVAKSKEFDLKKWIEELKTSFNSTISKIQSKPSDEISNKLVASEENIKKLVSENSTNEDLKSSTTDNEIKKENKKEKNVSTSTIKNDEKINREVSNTILDDNDIPITKTKKRKVAENKSDEKFSYDQLNPDDYAIWQPPEGK
jgi:hypothetical protein